MENKQKHKKVPTEVYAIELEKRELEIINLKDTISRMEVKEADINREFFNQGIELQRAQADADAFEKEAHSLRQEVEKLTKLNEMIVDDCNMGEKELRKEHETEREKFLDIFNEQNSEIFRLKEEVASLRYERRYGNWWNRLFRTLSKA